jgi:DNA-directed RNA polymerase specialized sigma subunit
MPEKPRLKELIAMVASGNQDALSQLVHRFIPIIKKYSHQLGYDEAYADLVIWVIEAVYRYHPNTTRDRVSFITFSNTDLLSSRFSKL